MYVKAVNDVIEKYPYSFGDLQAENPNTSFPEDPSDALLAEWDVYPVAPVAVPSYDAINQSVEQGAPVKVSGQWTQTWVVRPATAQEIADRTQALQSSIVAQTQSRLDTFARTRNYDGILSLCTYATSPTQKFADEGQYGITARDATWSKLYEILAEVQAGTRPMPSSYADIEPDLPPLAWPTP